MGWFISSGRSRVRSGSRSQPARRLTALSLSLAIVMGSLAPVARAQLDAPQNSLGSNGASWNFGNTNGVRRPGLLVPEGEADRSVSGFGLDDASMGALGQALDTSATLWINNEQFSDDDFTAGNGGVTAGPVALQGVSITVQHSAVVSGPILRSLVSIANPSGSPVTLSSLEWIFSEVGGDENATRATSSGDTNFTTEDRWMVSSDSDGTFAPGVPAVLYVLYGPGSPANTTASVATRVYQVGVASNNQRGMNAKFGPLTIPAGATRRLLFFTGLYLSNAEAAAGAAQFGQLSTCPFVGIPANQLAEIVNWSLAGNTARCSLFLTSVRHP